MTVDVRGQGVIRLGEQRCGPAASCTFEVRGTPALLAEPLGEPFWGWRGLQGSCDSDESCVLQSEFARVVAHFAPERGMLEELNSSEDGSLRRIDDFRVTPEGDVIATDEVGDRIWRITPEGDVLSFAGSGVAGEADGPALEARMVSPQGIARAADGTVFIVDGGNNRIRRLRGGVLETYAGTGEPASVDGPRLEASFEGPGGIAVGPGGRVYVFDGSTSAENPALRIIEGDVVRSLPIPQLDGMERPTTDDAGRVYWSTEEGIVRYDPSLDEVELVVERPCGRTTFLSAGSLDWRDGVLLESAKWAFPAEHLGGICRILPDGTEDLLLLHAPNGPSLGPDRQIRIRPGVARLADGGVIIVGCRSSRVRPPPPFACGVAGLADAAGA